MRIENEKIMSIQKFAYQLAQKIQNEHTVKISRSHIYEFIALYQGYQSYNAFVAKNLLLSTDYDSSKQFDQHDLLAVLTLKILNNPLESNYSNDDEIHWDDYEGCEFLEKIQLLMDRVKQYIKTELTTSEYLNISKTIYRELLWLDLSCLNFQTLRENFSYMDFENGQIQDEKDIFMDEFDIGFQDIASYLEKIKVYAKERNNMDAYAVLAKYYRYLANQIAPYGRDGSNFGSYWDNEKQKRIYTEESKQNIKHYDEFIKQAEQYEAFIKFAPVNLSEIDESADTETIYKQLIYLCNQGDLEAIEYFLYEKIFKSSSEAWVYIYFAQRLGTDFTKDDLCAYNAYTGEEYDDYGPIEVAGREAIQYVTHLENLYEEKEQLAHKIAQALFEKM